MFRKSWISLLIVCIAVNGFSQTIIKQTSIDQLKKIWQAEKGIVVINFWSTWCKPCIEEIPHFISIAQQLNQPKAQLWLVSLDTKEAFSSGQLATFVTRKGWKPNRFYWLDETDADTYCPKVDSSWSGVIPVTLIVHPKNGYHAFYEQPLSASELKKAINNAFRNEKKPAR